MIRDRWLLWLIFGLPCVLMVKDIDKALGGDGALIPLWTYFLSGVAFWATRSLNRDRAHQQEQVVRKKYVPNCPRCEALGVYDDTWDAYYCVEHGWLEKACTDPDCPYQCHKRPVFPEGMKR